MMANSKPVSTAAGVCYLRCGEGYHPFHAENVISPTCRVVEIFVPSWVYAENNSVIGQVRPNDEVCKGYRKLLGLLSYLAFSIPSRKSEVTGLPLAVFTMEKVPGIDKTADITVGWRYRLSVHLPEKDAKSIQLSKWNRRR